MVWSVSQDDPNYFYSNLNRGLWLEGYLSLIGVNMSKERVGELFRKGMQMVKDIWNLEEGRLYTWEEITEMFDLVPKERPFWRQLINSFPRD